MKVQNELRPATSRTSFGSVSSTIKLYAAVVITGDRTKRKPIANMQAPRTSEIALGMHLEFVHFSKRGTHRFRDNF